MTCWFTPVTKQVLNLTEIFWKSGNNYTIVWTRVTKGMMIYLHKIRSVRSAESLEGWFLGHYWQLVKQIPLQYLYRNQKIVARLAVHSDIPQSCTSNIPNLLDFQYFFPYWNIIISDFLFRKKNQVQCGFCHFNIISDISRLCGMRTRIWYETSYLVVYNNKTVALIRNPQIIIRNYKTEWFQRRLKALCNFLTPWRCWNHIKENASSRLTWHIFANAHQFKFYLWYIKGKLCVCPENIDPLHIHMRK